MSGHQTATVGDTVYFWFGANDTSGSGGDGATPLYDVREAGATAAAIPLLSGTPTLLSHANYPAGCYEIAVAATGGNGFTADDTFAVFCTLAIDSQNPTGFVGSCTLTPLAKAGALATAQTDLDTITGSDGATLATAQALYAPSKAGDAMDLITNAVDAAAIATAAITADSIATDAIGAAEFAQSAADKIWDTTTRILTASTNFNDISTAEVNTQCDLALTDIHLDHLLAVDYDPAAKPGVATALFNELVESDAGVSRYTANALELAPDTTTGLSVSTITDKTGYSLTQAFPTNFADLTITVSTGLVTVGTNNDKTGYTVSTVSDKTGYSISGTKTTLDALNDISTTQVNTEADLALTDIHLDHLLAVDYDPATKPGVGTALFNELIESNAGVSRYTAAALALAPTGGTAPTVAQIADGVWDEVLDSAHVVAESAAVVVAKDATVALDATVAKDATVALDATVAKAATVALDSTVAKEATVTGLNNISTTEVNTQVDLALTDIHLDHLLAADYDPATPPGVGTALFNELIESNAGVSRYTAAALAQAPTGGSAPTVAQIWDEVLDSTHAVADSAAQKIKDTLVDTTNMNGSDGVTLATAQANYAPSKAGNAMDLVAGAVDATSIASNAITSAKIATDAITAGAIAANSIGASELAADCIGSSQLANTAVDEIWQTVLTQSYAADGAEGTASQILYTMQQFLLDADIAGTTLTVRQLNGTSQAYVITVDNATTPTDKNRTA